MKQKKPLDGKDTQSDERLTLDDIDIYDFYPSGSNKTPAALPKKEASEDFDRYAEKVERQVSDPKTVASDKSERTSDSPDSDSRSDEPKIVFDLSPESDPEKITPAIASPAPASPKKEKPAPVAHQLDAEHIFRSPAPVNREKTLTPPKVTKAKDDTVIFSPVSSSEKVKTSDAPAKRNAFLESLDNLRPDDLAPASAKKRSRKSVSSVLSKVLIGFCGVIFVVSAAILIRHMVEYKIGDDLYHEISDHIFDEDLASNHELALSKSSMSLMTLLDYDSLIAHEKDPPLPYEDPGQSTYNPKFAQMKANLLTLKRQNPDIYGYIYIPNTKISYPVVRGTDNDFYLTHSYTGSDLIAGAIFADFKAADKVEDNRNLVFYGHNMQNGSMFNNVQLFQNEYVFKNTNIEFYNFDGIYIFEPFSIYDTAATENYFRMYFENDEEFVKFCGRRQNSSYFSKGIDFSPNDCILTLSSCTNAGDGRWVLHARLIRIER